MARIRTFVAVELSQSVRKQAIELIHRLDMSGASVGWVPSENMHISLKFLGNVVHEELPEICYALESAVRDMPEFGIGCCGAGAFPNAERPRTVWLGVQEGQDEMVHLQDVVEKALEPFRFRRENRQFRPHVTLGRVRGGSPNLEELARRIAKCADFEAGGTIVEEVILFASELKSTGPEYSVIGRAPLEG